MAYNLISMSNFIAIKIWYLFNFLLSLNYICNTFVMLMYYYHKYRIFASQRLFCWFIKFNQ